ncbi:MAG: Hsp20/alpha crystallin family protein [Planctomycetaceae bacterium]
MNTSSRPEGPLSQSVERLRGELDRWLDAAWSQGERAMDAFGLRPGKSWTPPIDIIENADSVRVLMNLPGVETSGIELTLQGNMLTVKGTFPSVDLGENGSQFLTERAGGEFRRSVPLPTTVDPDRISAVCQHGVLTVTVPKNEQLKARKIPITGGGVSM